jgi:hypothetical protein
VRDEEAGAVLAAPSHAESQGGAVSVGETRGRQGAVRGPHEADGPDSIGSAPAASREGLRGHGRGSVLRTVIHHHHHGDTTINNYLVRKSFILLTATAARATTPR